MLSENKFNIYDRCHQCPPFSAFSHITRENKRAEIFFSNLHKSQREKLYNLIKILIN